ncbi:MAG: cytochrome c oxidase subunit II transmembrane domain-containing protein [Acidobacteriota bacterium]
MELLFYIVLYFTIAAFVVVQVARYYSGFRSRYQDREKVEFSNKTWEGIWTAIPAAILLALILLI